MKGVVLVGRAIGYLRKIHQFIVMSVTVGWFLCLAGFSMAQQGPVIDSSYENSSLQVLSLSHALDLAKQYHPILRVAQAQTKAARSRTSTALAPFLPHFDTALSYKHTTDNYLEHVSTLARGFDVSQPSMTTQSYNYFQGELSFSLLIFDFGQSLGYLKVSKSLLHAQEHREEASLLALMRAVCETFFLTRAQKSLLTVAEENFANQEQHLLQVKGFVDVGTRPQIDLVQAQSEHHNARVMLIKAKNAYLEGKARLIKTLGVDNMTAKSFDVADDTVNPVVGEDGTLSVLVDEAISNRPDLQALYQQVGAAKQDVAAKQSGHWPKLKIGSAFTINASNLEELLWVWSFDATLVLPLFDGGLTNARVNEAYAIHESAQAQFEALRQSIRHEVEHAQLSVREGLASVEAATTALLHARQRLLLADGRYKTGVGNSIEVGDAQLALVRAAMQKVQVEYELALARVRLCAALGRSMVQ